MEQTTQTPRVVCQALTHTGCAAAQFIWPTIGLCPVSWYTAAGSDSTNFSLLPAVTVNLNPAEFCAVTWPGNARMGSPAGPPLGRGFR
jgi:hypothetical protein